MFMTIEDIVSINKKNGYTFFDKDVMELFQSTIESALHKNKYFITSEGSPKRFSIRKFNKKTGAIEDFSEIHAYKSLEEANEKLIKL